MSKRFDERLRDHGKKKVKHFLDIRNASKWMPFVNPKGDNSRALRRAIVSKPAFIIFRENEN
jgi:hypothetical protein